MGKIKARGTHVIVVLQKAGEKNVKTLGSNKAAQREQRILILHPNRASVFVCLEKLSLSFLSRKECMLIAEGKKI